jgi:16S rRNA (guanine(966)-N(2))-methyltransferase RsmD
MTRIVGGAAGGRRLAVPSSARPTTDRVREALSRGAASVLLVDSDRRAAEAISRNIATVGLPGATVRRGPVAAVLAGGTSAPVDLVLADPPYDIAAESIDEVLAGLSRHGWVGPGALVVVERPFVAPELNWPADWTPWPARRYGDTRLEAAEVDGGDGASDC